MKKLSLICYITGLVMVVSAWLFRFHLGVPLFWTNTLFLFSVVVMVLCFVLLGASQKDNI